MAISLGTLALSLVVNQSGFSEALQVAENQILAVAAATVKLGIDSVKAWASFDAAITHSTALVQDLSGDAFQRLSDQARKLALDSTNSAEELAKAYNVLHQAGFDAKEMQDGLVQVNRFSVATQSDLKESTEALAQALRTMGLASDDAATRASNLKGLTNELVQAEEMGAGSALELAHALGGRLGIEMRGLGIHTEEAISILAAFNKQGVEAGEASQFLARILNALQRNVVQHGDAWQKAGVQVMDAHGNLLPLAEIMEHLSKRMAGMSDAQRRLFFESLGFQDRFTDSQILALQALSGTTDAIEEMQAKLHGTGDAAEDAATKQLANLDDELTLLNHHWQDLKSRMGETLTPALMEFISFLGNAIDLSRIFLNLFGSTLSTVMQVVEHVTLAASTMGMNEMLSILSYVSELWAKVEGFFFSEPSGKITPEQKDKTGDALDPIAKATKTSARSFEQLSSRRFDVQALATFSSAKVIDVGDKVTHGKLDGIARLLENRRVAPAKWS